MPKTKLQRDSRCSRLAVPSNSAVTMAPKAKDKKPAGAKDTNASHADKKADKPATTSKATTAGKAPAGSRKRKADAQLEECQAVAHPSHGKVHICRCCFIGSVTMH